MNYQLKEETLDPENWEKFKELGHKMLEDALTLLQNIRDHPNLQQPEEALQKLVVPLSDAGEDFEQVYKILNEYLLPYHVNNTRPQFWGLVVGTGSPFGVLVDMLISSRNAGFPSFGEMPLFKLTMNWLKELLEVPKDYSGVFVSGGSEANYTGLAVARNAKAEVNMKTKGMQSVEKKMVLYGSEEMHHCLERSVELLGIGNEALRWIPVDEKYSIKLGELEKAIKEDKKQGLYPFCVIGNAGTVNTGAFDDFNSLADLCSRKDLWFHVDGAFGAWVKLSETHKHLADGLERADSIAVDLHKWMNMPYPIGFTLIRDKAAHYSTFVYGHEAKYLETALEKIDLDMATMMSSLALSRGNSGLKTYMLLRAYGKDKYRGLIQQNIAGIHYLAKNLENHPLFEVTAPVVSNIVCFRYNPGGLSEEELEKLNRMILGGLWNELMGYISDTTLKGKYMLRACNVNHRSKYTDFDVFIEKMITIGDMFIKEHF